jgi:hypothetical protein
MIDRMKSYAQLGKAFASPLAKAGLFGGLLALSVTSTTASARALLDNIRNS